MLALRTANLIIAFIATTAPIAHALEMISKLTLDGGSGSEFSNIFIGVGKRYLGR